MFKILIIIILIIGIGLLIGIGLIQLFSDFTSTSTPSPSPTNRPKLVVIPSHAPDPTPPPLSGESPPPPPAGGSPNPTIVPLEPNPPSANTQVETISSGIPITLRIPKIGVNARVESVGLDSYGAMGVPSTGYTTAWYNLGYRLTDHGSAVIAGHLDNAYGTAAVFWNIGKLDPGDELFVTDSTFKTYKYRVYEKQYYPYENIPLQRVFGSADLAGLNLITCAGTWNKAARNYSQRIVIYSQLIQ